GDRDCEAGAPRSGEEERDRERAPGGPSHSPRKERREQKRETHERGDVLRISQRARKGELALRIGAGESARDLDRTEHPLGEGERDEERDREEECVERPVADG